MKNQRITIKKYDDTKKTAAKAKVPNKKKQNKQTKVPPGQILLKFRYQKNNNQGKIIEVPCYEEKYLKWPTQLTKKIISHRCDNDQESNQEMLERETKKCVQNLFCEIACRKMQEIDDTRGF